MGVWVGQINDKYPFAHSGWVGDVVRIEQNFFFQNELDATPSPWLTSIPINNNIITNCSPFVFHP